MSPCLGDGVKNLNGGSNMNNTFEGIVERHRGVIEAGSYVTILSVDEQYGLNYPPVGSIVKVDIYPSTGELCLDCRELGYSWRTGIGLTYTVGTSSKITGLAAFLKEKGL